MTENWCRVADVRPARLPEGMIWRQTIVPPEGEKTMRRPLSAFAILLLSTAILQAGTKFTSTWRAPLTQPISFAGKKVAALVISNDQSLRMSSEEALSRELTARGMQGVAAYRLIPREELQDVERAKGWFQKAEVLAVVSLRPVSADRKVTYTPDMWMAPYYSTLWGYYGYGWGNVYIPGSVREDTILVIETLIHSVPQDKLLWAGTSETKNPSQVGQVVAELVKEAAKQIRKEGFVQSGSGS